MNSSYEYFCAMYGCGQALPPAEMEALLRWEAEHLGKGDGIGTADWPGWVKYIGPPPWRGKQAPARETSTKANVPFRLRSEVFKRDGFRCVDCDSQDDLCADHVIPECLGGPTTLENLRTRCRSCNSRKGSKPEAAR